MAPELQSTPEETEQPFTARIARCVSVLDHNEFKTNSAKTGNTMVLDKLQITTLLKAFDLQTQQALFIGGMKHALPCVPVGGDLLDDVILLSEISESHSQSKLAEVSTKKLEMCHLRVSLESQCLILEISLIERDQTRSYWKILGGHWRKNKRWQPRVCFKPFQSPKATIVREFQPNIVAELHDISDSALAVSFWNKDLQHEFRSGDLVNTHVVFNEYFSLRVDCHVIESRFIRKPCCHTRVRLRFSELNDVELSQLHLLIENMSQNLHAA